MKQLRCCLKMFSIALGEGYASLMHDSEGFLGQWPGDVSLGVPSDSSPCSHLSLSGNLHTCRQSQGLYSSVLLKHLHFTSKTPTLFSAPPLHLGRADVRQVPLARSKSLGKRHQLWDLLKSSLGLGFTGHNLQCAPSPQLVLESTGVTNIWGWALRP